MRSQEEIRREDYEVFQHRVALFEKEVNCETFERLFNNNGRLFYNDYFLPHRDYVKLYDLLTLEDRYTLITFVASIGPF